MSSSFEFPGTLIFTGTPPGVGMGRSPQVFVKENDVVEVEIEGIGGIRNKIVYERQTSKAGIEYLPFRFEALTRTRQDQ